MHNTFSAVDSHPTTIMQNDWHAQILFAIVLLKNSLRLEVLRATIREVRQLPLM